MSHFETEVVIPNRQPKVSAFFRVLAPGFLLTVFVAFYRVYYTMNGYPAPMLINILLILALCILPIVWWYTWYHNTIEKKGGLHVSDTDITVNWDNPKVVLKYPLSDLKDLHVIYDGYGGGLLNPYEGVQNRLQFTYNGEPHNLYFRLQSEEEAGEMAKVIKTWYECGLNFTELNTKGEERYLMLYAGQHKQALV